jgi:hypothetical protein
MKTTNLLRLSSLTLEPYDMDEMPPYVAASHVWSENLFPVSCYDGVRVDMCLGLELVKCVFEQRPYLADIQHLWIDTWCIDQANEEDKNHQIPMMGRIFSGAKVVLVVVRHRFTFCQTEWDDILSKLDEAIQVLRSHKWLSPEALDVHQSSFISHDLKRGMKIINELASLEWMKRVWTSQEYLLAKNIEWIGQDQNPLQLRDGDFLDVVTIYIFAGNKLSQNERCMCNMSHAKLGIQKPTLAMKLADGRFSTRREDEIYGLMGASGVVIDPLVGKNIDMEDIWQAWWEEAVRRGHLVWIMLPSYDSSRMMRSCARPNFDGRFRSLRESQSLQNDMLGPVEVDNGMVTFSGRNAGVCTLDVFLGVFESRPGHHTLISSVQGDIALATRIYSAMSSGLASAQQSRIGAEWDCTYYNWRASGRIPSRDEPEYIEVQTRLGKPIRLAYRVPPAGNVYLATLQNDLKRTDVLVTVNGEVPRGEGQLIAVSLDAFSHRIEELQILLILHDPDLHSGGTSRGIKARRSLHKVGVSLPIFIPKDQDIARAEERNGYVFHSPLERFSVGGEACSYCQTLKAI